MDAVWCAEYASGRQGVSECCVLHVGGSKRFSSLEAPRFHMMQCQDVKSAFSLHYRGRSVVSPGLLGGSVVKEAVHCGFSSIEQVLSELRSSCSRVPTCGPPDIFTSFCHSFVFP